MKRVIKITEYLQKIFTVEASDENAALDIVNKKYNKGNIILTAEDFIGNEIKDITKKYSIKKVDELPTIKDVAEEEM